MLVITSRSFVRRHIPQEPHSSWTYQQKSQGHSSLTGWQLRTRVGQIQHSVSADYGLHLLTWRIELLNTGFTNTHTQQILTSTRWHGGV
jgi:hypothetical protein